MIIKDEKGRRVESASRPVQGSNILLIILFVRVEVVEIV
jgi:hypothetical protein